MIKAETISFRTVHYEEADHNLTEWNQTVLALDGLTKVEKVNIKHREEAEEWMLYAEGDSAAAHHLYEGFSHLKKLEIICYGCSKEFHKDERFYQ